MPSSTLCHPLHSLGQLHLSLRQLPSAAVVRTVQGRCTVDHQQRVSGVVVNKVKGLSGATPIGKKTRHDDDAQYLNPVTTAKLTPYKFQEGCRQKSGCSSKEANHIETNRDHLPKAESQTRCITCLPPSSLKPSSVNPFAAPSCVL